ncbi:tyrosine-type recombinase/integrase [Geobacillus thermodenitrificans]|uniref:tyrosine-type recombinase/integrase n=1 Tax=Geobacillus thermodenitrificans TaxID=33940 RepID=UPI003D1C6C89
MGRKRITYATPEKLEKVNPKNVELIRKYFVFKNMNLSESSKISYQSDFNQWLVYIMENYENRYILDIINEDVDDMIDLLEDFIAFCTSVLGNNERRIQRRMSSISSFFLYLRKKRKIRENPIDFLDRPKVSVGEKLQIKQTFLTKEQVEEIRKGLKEIGDLQLELFFEFGLSTMARANAISNVKIEQINFEKNRVEDVLEKEGYRVTLFPSQRTMELIKQWLKYREEQGIENEYLFITKYGGQWKKVEKSTLQSSWIKKIGNIIGIPELHCHDLRHSGSNLLYHSGMKLEDVSLLLNHRGTDVTRQHYLEINKDAIQDKKAQFEI